MTTAQLSMIAPPPSVAAVLGALTDETRIGQVDFSTRLAPEPEPAPEPTLDGYDEVVVLGDGDEADLAPEDSEDSEDGYADEDADEDADEQVTAEVVTLVSVPDLVAHDSDDTAEEAPTKAPRLKRRAAAQAAAPAPVDVPADAPTDVPTAAPAAPETTTRIVVDEPVVPATLRERIHEPTRLQPFEEPACRVEADERPAVEEIARLVIERMHDAELAMMRHLDAIEVESARRNELLTAQAELDAELIRLSARREAHGIVTAARVRAGGEATVGAEERQLDELTESLSRFAEVMDELRPVGTRSVSWGRTP